MSGLPPREAGLEQMYDLQRLLWDIRKKSTLAERFRKEPDAVLDEYGIENVER